MKRMGSPRSVPIVCINTGKIYRDSREAHIDLSKEYPNLKYADIVQRVRGGGWIKLIERLGGLDFRKAKKEEIPFKQKWLNIGKQEKNTRVNEVPYTKLDIGSITKIAQINKATEEMHKSKNKK